MGKGTLQVWVTEPKDACTISSSTWRINIAHCDGRILDWCGKRYFNLPAPCGNLEIELPPGRYIVRGARGVRLTPGGRLRGNIITDSAIVNVCCDQKVCVTLYPPEIHLCGFLFALAVRQHVSRRLVPKALAERAIDAIDEIMALEPPAETTALNMENLAALAQAANKEPTDRKKRTRKKK